mmetsp:Transcript_17764/g.53462  ORF Transcript_17764/g.53462 Transcript_17764/m.53462 type:complete len:233 (+) Transcript_17764:440-1138(+)
MDGWIPREERQLRDAQESQDPDPLGLAAGVGRRQVLVHDADAAEALVLLQRLSPLQRPELHLLVEGGASGELHLELPDVSQVLRALRVRVLAVMNGLLADHLAHEVPAPEEDYLHVVLGEHGRDAPPLKLPHRLEAARGDLLLARHELCRGLAGVELVDDGEGISLRQALHRVLVAKHRRPRLDVRMVVEHVDHEIAAGPLGRHDDKAGRTRKRLRRSRGEGRPEHEVQRQP